MLPILSPVRFARYQALLPPPPILRTALRASTIRRCFHVLIRHNRVPHGCGRKEGEDRVRCCPYCNSPKVCVSHRSGAWETLMLPALLGRPYSCLSCKRRHYRFVAGVFLAADRQEKIRRARAASRRHETALSQDPTTVIAEEIIRQGTAHVPEPDRRALLVAVHDASADKAVAARLFLALERALLPETQGGDQSYAVQQADARTAEAEPLGGRT